MSISADGKTCAFHHEELQRLLSLLAGLGDSCAQIVTQLAAPVFIVRGEISPLLCPANRESFFIVPKEWIGPEAMFHPNSVSSLELFERRSPYTSRNTELVRWARRGEKEKTFYSNYRPSGIVSVFRSERTRRLMCISKFKTNVLGAGYLNKKIQAFYLLPADAVVLLKSPSRKRCRFR